MYNRSDYYANYISFKEKLIVKFNEQQKKKNAPIHIQDIFIYPGKGKEGAVGEAKVQNHIHTHFPESVRLLDHIEFLANIANEYHQAQYCQKNNDGTYTIRPECLNKITRLSLHEFSLYTAQPIDQADFSFLLESIELIVKNQHSNVHLLLSSLPVVTDGNEILNVCLYVQCGKEFIIETFSKTYASRIDHTYQGTINFTQPGENHDLEWTDKKIKSSCMVNNKLYLSEINGFIAYSVITPKGEKIFDFCTNIQVPQPLTKAALLELQILILTFAIKEGHILIECEFIAKTNGLISNNNIFRVSTAGGCQYLQIIDICIDHTLAFSKHRLKKILEIDILNNHDMIPNQVDQLITSNCIRTNIDSLIAEKAFNINPKRYIPLQKEKDFIKPIHFSDNPIIKIYPKMSIHKTKHGAFIVNNPPFGCSYTVIATEERSLSGFNKDFKNLVEVRNNKVRKYILKSSLEQTPLFFNYYSDKTMNRLKKLLSDMMERCKPNNMEKLFKPESYYFKLKIIDYIDQSFDDIFSLKTKDHAFFMHHINILLSALKIELEHMSKYPTHDLIKDIVAMLDHMNHQIKPIAKLKVG